MTVTTNKSKSNRWVADGYNRTWSYPFKALTATDVVLDVTDPTGFETTVTAGFQVNNLNQDGGGTVIYPIDPAPPLAAQSVVVVRRNTQRTQPYKVGSQGRYFPETHENMADNLENQIQELALTIDRAVRVPFSDDAGMKPLPDKAHRSGKLFAFDINGDPSTANVDVQDILDARDAAEAAAVDANDTLTLVNVGLSTQSKIYLGSRSTPPTANDDGTPLWTGAEYFSTTDSTRYSWTGSAWIAAGAASIPGNFVDNARLADMAGNTIKGRQSTSGDPQDLSMATVKTMLGNFSAGAAGLVPSPGVGDSTRFLRADGTWGASPAAVTAAYLQVYNSDNVQLVRDGGIYMMANGVPKIIPAAGLFMSASATGLGVGSLYYVGVADLDNDGILDSMAPFWVGSYTYANDPTTYLPVIVQDTRYSVVGMVLAASGPSFVDNEVQRWVASYYNPRPKALRLVYGPDTTGGPTLPAWGEISSALRVSLVMWGQSLLNMNFTGSIDTASNSTASGYTRVTWMVDGATNTNWGMEGGGFNANPNSVDIVPITLSAQMDLAEGYHYIGVHWQNTVAAMTSRMMWTPTLNGMMWG
jgi:hypothetical protein